MKSTYDVISSYVSQARIDGKKAKLDGESRDSCPYEWCKKSWLKSYDETAKNVLSPHAKIAPGSTGVR